MKPKKSRIRRVIALLVFFVIILTAGFILIRVNIAVFKKAFWELKGRPAGFGKYTMNLVKGFTFSEENALKEWDEKILKGRVEYRVEKDLANSFVHATSYKTASALYYKISLDVKNREPVIKWKWRVEKFPEKEGTESLEEMSDDDFAARIYVIFPARFFTHTKVVEYVWTEKLPAGETGISPYSGNIRLMVIRSGYPETDEFYHEERDVIKDYVTLYGERPRRNVGAIAFMTDADTSKTAADALYADIQLGYKDEVLLQEGAR